VAEALDDGDRNTRWWYGPSTGQIEPGLVEWMVDELGDDNDMVTFASAVERGAPTTCCAGRLEGRVAFRRFRDTPHDVDDLVGPWRPDAQARSEKRAIEWLADEGHRHRTDADAAGRP
jgi:hypothetical protein